MKSGIGKMSVERSNPLTTVAFRKLKNPTTYRRNTTQVRLYNPSVFYTAECVCSFFSSISAISWREKIIY